MSTKGKAVSPARALFGRYLRLSGVDWKTYTLLLKAFADRRGVRLTYDRGELEIMSPTFEHDNDAYMLGRFVDALTEELGLPIKGGRSTTFRRKKKQRGLEPDNCFWIANEAKIRGLRQIDLRIHPPPDLAIEVDVTHQSINRMRIYAALGVPEVWRLSGDVLAFHVLGTNNRYTEAAQSRAVPLVAPADLTAFLPLRATLDDNEVVRRFRDWVRQRRAVAPPGGTP
jgi:Uma2 family endonuclease